MIGYQIDLPLCIVNTLEESVMPECNNCGQFVTTDFVRVFGDDNGELTGCLHCLDLTEFREGGATRGDW